MIRVKNRWEIQAQMMRTFISNTGKFSRLLYTGIDSAIREFFYSIAWILEGMYIAIHMAAMKYHKENVEGEDLIRFANDINLKIGTKGNKARGLVILYSNGPNAFTKMPGDLSIIITINGTVYTYNPETMDPIFFTLDNNGGCFAKTWYTATDVGPDYNGIPDSKNIKLQQPDSKITMIELSGNGFVGGTLDNYSDAEIRQQYESYFQGLQSGNRYAYEFNARKTPGVVIAKSVADYPLPGEVSLFVADSNGYTTAKIMQNVTDFIRGDGINNFGCDGLGIPFTVRRSRSWAAIADISILIGSLVDENIKSTIASSVMDQINNMGFGPSFDIETVKAWVKIDKSINVLSLIIYCWSSPEQIPGVYMISGSKQEWVGNKILRYNSINKLLSFADGSEIEIGLGGQFTLNGLDGSFIKISVEPSELPTKNRQETIERVMVQSGVYTFDNRSVVRLKKVNFVDSISQS